MDLVIVIVFATNFYFLCYYFDCGDSELIRHVVHLVLFLLFTVRCLRFTLKLCGVGW